MASFLFGSKRKMFWYIFLFALAFALIDYFIQQQKDAEWDRKVMQERKQNHFRQDDKNYSLSPEQKQRQKEAIEDSNSKSTEPLPSEVEPDDEEMYNWIIDHPDYNGDYEFFKEKYESEHGDYDDYDK